MSASLKAKIGPGFVAFTKLSDLEYNRRFKKNIKDRGIKGNRFCIEAQAEECEKTVATLKVILNGLEHDRLILMEETDVPCENKIHSDSDFMMNTDADLQIHYEPCFTIHIHPFLYRLNQEELIEFAGKKMAQSIMWIEYSIERDKKK